jgi:hypothetical protein
MDVVKGTITLTPEVDGCDLAPMGLLPVLLAVFLIAKSFW